MSEQNILNNDDYAKQWIEFLKRRNALLGVLWPLFLVLAIAACFAAFYYQQSGVTAAVEAKLAKHESSELKAELDQLKARTTKLKDEKEKQQSIIADLKAKSDVPSEVLVLNAQKISNLESQISLLTSEKEALIESLEESNALLVLHKGKLEKNSSVSDDLMEEKAKLISKIESSRLAYTALTKRLKEMQAEMDRLVSVNTNQEIEITQLNSKLKKAREDSQQFLSGQVELQKQLSAADSRLKELKSKLDSIVAPISSGGSNGSSAPSRSSNEAGSPATTQSTVTLQSAGSTTDRSLAFEEIKAQPKAPVSSSSMKKNEKGDNGDQKVSTSATFDYDKISIP